MEAYMISFPIIDSHVHLWDVSRLKYTWLQSEPTLNGVFLPEQYRQACGSIKVEKMVFVQCECAPEQAMQEARFITELAATENSIAAIIPYAPLENGEAVRKVLEELAQNKLVKGIRRMIEFENDIDFCLRPDFVKGVKILADYNFSFDININHSQIANTIKLVKQCPNTRFMLDHAGKPDIKNNIFDSWQKEIKELSTFQNVYCKLSHLVNKAGENNCNAETLKPYITHVIDCFGFDRVVFASDWPICNLVSDISSWFNALELALGNITHEESYKLFYKNAEDFYRV
jgi:L-fuconolactonase